ncbi:hypothetical protein PC119_g5009 [Phytophthora cactorum]|uniref:Uncharacterized protein n=1 Tax=Phytophthora cactorum TaxID=29920 RepID=A0A8T1D662_9STRA|nr:hypothetical protein PC111_g4146 [Phytophthora cactorum]KAG2863686.1 hypothetical protein PC113_g5231 [Phytophthora cactorum]KAG2936794.1 hypothetical protein PC115_g4579 [Phytophthora cactorum]KAG2949513.1 hypothetical protein PC117_g5198 [Phytophthora cactorum]KAG3025462.1 hypothetical protein PC120_g6456 [Phytophthora cactorum]
MAAKPPLRWHACTSRHKDRAGDPYVKTFVAQRAVCVPLCQAGCRRALGGAVTPLAPILADKCGAVSDLGRCSMQRQNSLNIGFLVRQRPFAEAHDTYGAARNGRRWLLGGVANGCPLSSSSTKQCPC